MRTISGTAAGDGRAGHDTKEEEVERFCLQEMPVLRGESIRFALGAVSK